MSDDKPALLLIGHGSRSEAGVAEFWDFTKVLQSEAPDIAMEFGFIELAEPHLDTALDELVARGPCHVIGVPLVLLGAGHMKNDGPACLERARRRHPEVRFTYGTEMGIHPLALSVAEDRAMEVVADHGLDPAEVAVLLVGRGSSDPDANADLAKLARLVWDGRGIGWVEPAFISLASPSVPEGLERCRRLGARHVVVIPYFLFTGVLVDRIRAQAAEWTMDHPEVNLIAGPHLGCDPRLARLVIERFHQAGEGTGARPNCDCCVYRVALPGYEAKVGLPLRAAQHDHDHRHGHDHSNDHQHREEVNNNHGTHRAT